MISFKFHKCITFINLSPKIEDVFCLMKSLHRWPAFRFHIYITVVELSIGQNLVSNLGQEINKSISFIDKSITVIYLLPEFEVWFCLMKAKQAGWQNGHCLLICNCGHYSQVTCLLNTYKWIASLSLTARRVNVLCPWVKQFICCLVLVQLRKTPPDITEKLLMRTKVDDDERIIPNKTSKCHIHSVAICEFPKWQKLFQLQKFKYI